MRYGVEQALRECLDDMQGLRKQVRKRDYRPGTEPLVEVLIKLRAEALQLLVLRARLIAAKQQKGAAEVGGPSGPGTTATGEAPEAEAPEPVVAGKGG